MLKRKTASKEAVSRGRRQQPPTYHVELLKFGLPHLSFLDSIVDYGSDWRAL